LSLGNTSEGEAVYFKEESYIAFRLDCETCEPWQYLQMHYARQGLITEMDYVAKQEKLPPTLIRDSEVARGGW
jgi:hypothetical protein